MCEGEGLTSAGASADVVSGAVSSGGGSFRADFFCGGGGGGGGGSGLAVVAGSCCEEGVEEEEEPPEPFPDVLFEAGLLEQVDSHTKQAITDGKITRNRRFESIASST